MVLLTALWGRLGPARATVFEVATRSFSKYFSKSKTKRGRLTTKQATKQGYYKGKRSTVMGRHTSKAKYIIDPAKVPRLVVPDLSDCTFKPYVAMTVPKQKYPLPAELLKQALAKAAGEASPKAADAAAAP